MRLAFRVFASGLKFGLSVETNFLAVPIVFFVFSLRGLSYPS